MNGGWNSKELDSDNFNVVFFVNLLCSKHQTRYHLLKCRTIGSGVAHLFHLDYHRTDSQRIEIHVFFVNRIMQSGPVSYL